MSVTNTQILKLYKNLLRYSQQLQYTDKEYFCRRIKHEFKQNKNTVDEADVLFNYKKGVSLLERKAVQ